MRYPITSTTFLLLSGYNLDLKRLQKFDKRFVRHALFSEFHHLGYMVTGRIWKFVLPFLTRHAGILLASIVHTTE
jgi:hypothetical protein